MESIYRDFFTQEEIDSILEGKDYWLSPDEVTERLQKRNELLEAEKAAETAPKNPRKRAKKA
jgi:hypothetical protein